MIEVALSDIMNGKSQEKPLCESDNGNMMCWSLRVAESPTKSFTRLTCMVWLSPISPLTKHLSSTSLYRNPYYTLLRSRHNIQHKHIESLLYHSIRFLTSYRHATIVTSLPWDISNHDLLDPANFQFGVKFTRDEWLSIVLWSSLATIKWSYLLSSLNNRARAFPSSKQEGR